MFKNESGILNDTILLLSKYIIIIQIRVWIIKDFKQVIRLWSNIVSKISLNNLNGFSLRFENVKVSRELLSIAISWIILVAFLIKSYLTSTSSMIQNDESRNQVRVISLLRIIWYTIECNTCWSMMMKRLSQERSSYKLISLMVRK